jgi:hypothetical protein
MKLYVKNVLMNIIGGLIAKYAKPLYHVVLILMNTGQKKENKSAYLVLVPYLNVKFVLTLLFVKSVLMTSTG